MRGKKGGKNVYKVFVAMVAVLVFIVVGLYGVVVLQSKKAVIEKSVGDFKILSIREVFENNFKDAKVQVSLFSNPRITGLDEMKNVFTLEVESKGNIKLFVNGASVEMPAEQYSVLYKKALFNIISNNAPEDYRTTNPAIIFEHIKDYNYEYLTENGKEFIVLKGKNNLDDVEIWFLFRRINDKLKFFAERVFVNGVELSGVKKTAFLSSVYQVEKKIVKSNLIDIVLSSKLLDFPDTEISSVFDNLKNSRWSVKDEDNNLVECTAINSVGNTEESIVVGFRLRDDGYVDLAYFYLDGTELPENEAYNKVRNIYKQFGKFDEKQYIENIIEKIKASKVPEKDKSIGEFLEERKNLFSISWSHLFNGRDTEIILKGSQKSGNLNFEVRFLSSRNELYLTKSYLNNKEIKPTDLFLSLEKPQTSEQVVDVSSKYINLVKNSSIVTNSQFKNNASAFQNFLKNPVWNYNEKSNRVILTGNGKYGTRNWNFKFVFEFPVPNKVLLENAYANNIEMIDEVRDYVISKVFKVSKIGENLPILVKNTVFKNKTYGEILGEKNWTVDMSTDLVVYNNDKLRISFFVEPNGDVKISDFYYGGKRYDKDALELLSLAEKGNGIRSIQMALEKGEQASTEQVSTKNQSTEETPTLSVEEPIKKVQENPEVQVDIPENKESEEDEDEIETPVPYEF